MSDLILYYTQNGAYVFSQFLRHFQISILGVLLAAIIAIPLSFIIARKEKITNIIISLANILQTVPSVAMLAILMFVMGIGKTTVVFVVFLYSLLPIFKNTISAIKSVDSNIIDASKGMGMTRFQIMSKVELPLALPIIMGGLRNALVLAIGITAVGTFIGAGGLGDIITRGINVAKGGPIIIAGAIPTAFMAVIADWALGYLEKKLDPRR